ncbi:MAG: putative Ig domain-containing protein [Acidobacteriota bacterium]
MSHRRILHAITPILLASTLTLPVFAQQAKQGNDLLDDLVMEDPAIWIGSSQIDADVALPTPQTEAFRRFQTETGGSWRMWIEQVTGNPAVIEGSGIPWIAGAGNQLLHYDHGVAVRAEETPLVPRQVMVEKALSFISAHPDLFGVDRADLTVNEVATGPILDYLYYIHFNWKYHGIPVENAQVIFRLNHGNLVQFGMDYVSGSIHNLNPTPAVTLGQAWAMVNALSRSNGLDVAVEPGRLVVMPVSAYPVTDVASPAPVVYRLVWVLSFRRAGTMGTWEARIDAHTGELVSFKDVNQYGQIQGGTYTTDAPQTESTHPYPYCDYQNNTYADAAGVFPGNVGTSTMSGQFVNTNDTCGAASLNANASGLIDFGTSGGTNCTTPGFGGNGNTHSSRTQYFNVEAIREKARAYLPANAWLGTRLGVNVNLNQTCNAYWNGSTLNFFRSGGGCGNTGELPGVSLHEWGHGMDQNDGGGTGGSGESYADICWMVQGHVSCIGNGFFQSGNCNGYGDPCLSCTGVRDHDYQKHQSGNPHTPATDQALCGGGGGPCGREVHCESAPSSEAIFDLATRDLVTWGLDANSAWALVDKLWFASRPSAGALFFACNNNNSCSATHMFRVLRVVDDCDGNLANGTPHASAIFAALGRHQIGCATDVNTDNNCACAALATPVLVGTPGPNQVVLTWGAIAGATSYDVLRNEVGCNAGFILIANTAATTYTDTTAVNGFTYYYRIQAKSSAACPPSRVSNCVTVTPGGSCGTITVNPASLPNGTVGVAYSQTVSASGGTAPYTFAVTAGALPNGVVLNAATGVVSGVPTTAGTFNFTITATDAASCTGNRAYTVVISCPTITVNPASLPNGTQGVPYSQTVTGSGGTAPYTFAVTSGALPPGLALNAATGVVSGTPTTAGTFNFTITATDSLGCTGSRAYSVVINCGTITVNPASLPNGTVGVPYSQTLSASGGAAPYTFAITAGALPPGLALNGATGVISGTPTTTGSFNFTITATDASGCTGTRAYTISSPCGTITVNPASLPGGAVGVPYSQTVTGSGGTAPYTFAVTAGALPPGLALNGATGVISGTPTATGTFNFTITATDANSCTGNRAYSIVISCAVITVSPGTLPNGSQGVPYSQTVSASGGTAPYTFAVTAGALPPGLALNGGTGVISGTPTTPGTYNFTITATDANSCTGSQAYTVVISCATITISPASLPNGTVGVPYSQTVTANGGTAPYTFAVTAGTLPAGLSLNGATGVISGTPTAAGTSNFTVTATDANGCTASQPYSLTIDCAGLSISPATLPNATLGVPYSQTVTASGGTAPYTYAVTAGALPTGLALNAGTGVISGTPTTPGSFSFTVTATDSAGCTVGQAYTINVNCPGMSISPATLPNGFVGIPYSQTVTASGGTAPYTYAITAGALPPGLALNAASGVISGTPTAAGNFSFTVTATDSAGCSASQAYTITVTTGCGMTISPATLPNGTEGLAYSQTLTANGGTPPYAWFVTSGALPSGLLLGVGTGAITGTPSAAGSFSFDVTVSDSALCTAVNSYTIDIAPAVDYILGQGLGQPNGNIVTVYKRNGTPSGIAFTAYGSGQYGTNVSSADVNGAIYGEIVTGPGPGVVYGPHIRGWARTGLPIAKISFFAYSTLRYGANPGGSDVDGDGYGEILSGPGPGAVFGPHVRGWNFDNTILTAISKISYFAYGTLKYGVNVEDGSVDADTFGEILTGPGPGIMFAPQVRGWNFDGSVLTSIAKINFNAFSVLQYGAQIAGGDVDNDGFAEIAASPGAGAGRPAQFRGFNYDNGTIAQLSGFDITPFTTSYGGRVGLGDLLGDGTWELVAGAGPDATAASTTNGYSYNGTALTAIPGSGFQPFTSQYGVTVSAGAIGYY